MLKEAFEVQIVPVPQGALAVSMVQGIGGGRTALPSQRRRQNQSLSRNRDNRDGHTAAANGRKRKREVTEVDQENQQVAGQVDLKFMNEERVQQGQRERQQSGLKEQQLEKDEIDERGVCGVEEDGSKERNSVEYGSGGRGAENNYPINGPTIAQDDRNAPTTTNPNTMPAQEKKWWAMNFDDLYKYARTKTFGKTGKEGRKSGRVMIIKWLCEKEGITRYVAPSIATAEATPIIARPTVSSTGAVSHPEAVLRTSDPDLQRLINEKEEFYKEKPAAELMKFSMERSYQLFKDSNGKLLSKSIAALSKWLAAWDVLKSPREKRWWLGDGIDLVNKAKAMGYQGPSRKYDVIVWLRYTPEDAEFEVAEVAEPTPNKKLEAKQAVSKRHAKGSRRPRYDRSFDDV
jgi:hypothetical protein